MDVGFNVLVPFAYLPLFHIQATAYVLGLDLLLNLLRIGVWVSLLVRALRPVEACARVLEPARSDKLLRQADDVLQRTAVRFCTLYAVLWGSQYLVLTILLVYFGGDGVALGPRVLPGALLMAGAQIPGSFAFAFPLLQYLLSSEAGRIHAFARQRGLLLDRPLASLQIRLAILAMCIGVGPTAWMAAVGYMAAHDAAISDAGSRAERVAADVARRVERLAPDGAVLNAESIRAILESARTRETTVFLADSRKAVAARQELAELPELKAFIEEQLGADGVLTDARASTSAAVRHTVRNGSVVAVARASTDATSSFLTTISMFAIIVALWAPLCAVLVSRSVAIPIQRVTALARQIVNVGNISEIKIVKVAQHDEVGLLSESFNELLDLFVALSSAARKIAKGELDIQLAAAGELPDAFREMASALQRMVREIRETSVQLATAASELYAASQEQEAWATSQSVAMEEIARTASSLSDAASHVAGAVSGVLGNAEKTLQTTETMATRIEELSRHAGRIGEILDVIREIADRSDLLALNGSLEACRAGDSGRGFALVASEMRRLAEKVTASVSDVQALTSDIRASGSGAIVVTEESKKLAEDTTEAARQITLVTQQQQSGTEQVSVSVRNVAEVLAQAVAATTHTRTSAEDLKAQAERLASLVRRFQISEEQAA
jgi:methyl-accepting chemotaxis protein